MLNIEAPGILSLPEGYTARPATLADVEAAVALFNACSRALIGADEFTLADVTNEWQSPNFDLARNTQLILAPDGSAAGYANVWDRPPHAQIEQWLGVPPAHTGRGLDHFLAAWAEARARQSIAQAPEGTRVVLTAWVLGIDAAVQDLLRQRGFTLVRRNLRMIIDLDPASPPPAPEWPAGVGVRALVPGQDDEAALLTVRAAFKDHWGYVEHPLEEGLANWRHNWQHDPSFDPSLWFLATAGDEIVGTSFCRLSINEDPETAWIFSLGVVRPWRRQGLALALLRHSLLELYRRGRRKVALGVDAGSLTGATRLYEKAGMRVQPERTYHIWEKELRAGRELATTDAPPSEGNTGD